MNAMKPVLTVNLGVDTDSLSRRLDEEGIIYRWQQAASEQLLLVDSESNSERIAQLIHDWRLEQSSSRGMVDVQSIKTWLVRSTRLFPLTVLLMVINVVCLPAGLSLADSGEVTELLRALSPYAIVLSPQGYLLQPLADGLADGGWWRLVTPMLLHFSWLHITFNLLWVWEVGRRIEYIHGWRWLVIVTMTSLGRRKRVAGDLCTDAALWRHVWCCICLSRIRHDLGLASPKKQDRAGQGDLLGDARLLDPRVLRIH